ncbi:MAG: hypothetical protein ACI4V1_07615 [Eubacteriales bacterium]
MDYKYTEKEDFSFLASGNVIKHFSGMPCFPVRPGLELFERAYHLIEKEKITVYDPCCGSGFSLTVLGMVKQKKIDSLYGSDIDAACLEAASCNLAMLTREGLLSARDKVLRNENITELRREQLNDSVARLLPSLVNPAMRTGIFRQDILQASPVLPERADYVFADIPYGRMTEWKTESEMETEEDPIQRFLAHIAPVMADHGVLVICGAKDLRLRTELFRKTEKIRLGKRLIYFLRKI